MSDVTLDKTLAALDAASEEAAESSTDAIDEVDEAAEAAEATPKVKGKPGAEARIRELNAKAKVSEAEAAKFKAELETFQTKYDKLTELLAEKEEHSQMVQKIQHMYATKPELKEHIETIDKALKGVFPNDQPADKTEAKPEEKTLKAIETVKSQLEEQQAALAERIAEQEAQALVAQADTVMNKLMAALPDKYEEKDKAVISRVLEDEVDWEAIEADPRVLSRTVEKAFQDVVNWYGDPRGALKTQQTETTESKATKISVDDILGKDWGKLKETSRDKSGRVKAEPVVSDADFTKVLGEMLRRQNAQ